MFCDLCVTQTERHSCLLYEQELGIKNHYHKKKLQLALQAIGSDTRSQMDDLDHNWVTRE